MPWLDFPIFLAPLQAYIALCVLCVPIVLLVFYLEQRRLDRQSCRERERIAARHRALEDSHRLGLELVKAIGGSYRNDTGASS